MHLGNPDRAVGGLAVRTPAGVELRPAGREDLEVALAFANDMYGLPVADPGPRRPAFERLVNDVDAATFLALADGEPAGMVILRFRRRLNVATWEGWLSDLYVVPEHRRRGIGKALLQAVVEEWRLRQGHRIMLEVDLGNAPAEALYRAAGFTEFGPHFQLRPLAPGPGVASPADVQIRPWETDDAEAVTSLVSEFSPRRTPPTDRLEAVHRTYRAIVGQPATVGWLAVLDGSPVGMIDLELREPFFLTYPVAWIPDLIVTEAAHGRGIGGALLSTAIAEAHRLGAEMLVLESGTQRAAAHRLYGRAGFTETGRTLVLRRE
jgi:GNAT superfamily N-acetyltransferase